MCTAIGVLVDIAGDDVYEATARAAGFGSAGVGAFLDLAGDDFDFWISHPYGPTVLVYAVFVTDTEVGYLLMDIGGEGGEDVVHDIAKLDTTIRARLLY